MLLSCDTLPSAQNRNLLLLRTYHSFNSMAPQSPYPLPNSINSKTTRGAYQLGPEFLSLFAASCASRLSKRRDISSTAACQLGRGVTRRMGRKRAYSWQISRWTRQQTCWRACSAGPPAGRSALRWHPRTPVHRSRVSLAIAWSRSTLVGRAHACRLAGVGVVL